MLVTMQVKVLLALWQQQRECCHHNPKGHWFLSHRHLLRKTSFYSMILFTTGACPPTTHLAHHFLTCIISKLFKFFSIHFSGLCATFLQTTNHFPLFPSRSLYFSIWFVISSMIIHPPSDQFAHSWNWVQAQQKASCFDWSWCKHRVWHS